MRLPDIVRAVQTDLPITMMHDVWLGKNAQPRYSEQAVEFGKRALTGEFQSRKRMPFRASATGMCLRRRIFSALEVTEAKFIDSKLANIFHTGNFLHLKWQMAGLTAGWLTEAEVVADNPATKCSGTLDGIVHDGSGFEFKTINSRNHTFTWRDPKELHIRQVHAYMYLRPDIDKFSIIYENKDTAEWREMRVHKDPRIIHQIDRETYELNQAFTNRVLPPVLPDCAQRTGSVYKNCPFASVCLAVKKWPVVVNHLIVGG